MKRRFLLLFPFLGTLALTSCIRIGDDARYPEYPTLGEYRLVEEGNENPYFGSSARLLVESMKQGHYREDFGVFTSYKHPGKNFAFRFLECPLAEFSQIHSEYETRPKSARFEWRWGRFELFIYSGEAIPGEPSFDTLTFHRESKTSLSFEYKKSFYVEGDPQYSYEEPIQFHFERYLGSTWNPA